MKSRVLVVLAVIAGAVVGVSASQALPGGGGNPVFDGVTPVRILDTRKGLGAPEAPLGPEQSLEVLVAGANGIPAEATSVVMNVTAVGASTATHLTVWPTGETRPNASNLNPSNANPAPNLVTVAIGTDGRVSIFNKSGSVHVIADVVGYYRDHDHDDRYYTQAEVDDLTAAHDARLDAAESEVTGLITTVSSLEEEVFTLQERALQPSVRASYSREKESAEYYPTLVWAKDGLGWSAWYEGAMNMPLYTDVPVTRVRASVYGNFCGSNGARPRWAIAVDGTVIPTETVHGDNPEPRDEELTDIVLEAALPSSTGLHQVSLVAFQDGPLESIQCGGNKWGLTIELLG